MYVTSRGGSEAVSIPFHLQQHELSDCPAAVVGPTDEILLEAVTRSARLWEYSGITGGDVPAVLADASEVIITCEAEVEQARQQTQDEHRG